MPGTSTAYWGPQIKIGPVQPALNVDMDAYTNVESLHFTFDQEKNRIPIVYIYNEQTGVTIPIPIPPITPLNPPLGADPAAARRTSWPTCSRSATTSRSGRSRRRS